MECIGYYKNGKYQNIYGAPLKCFKCNSNLCVGSKSFPLINGGHAELLHCEEHNNDATLECEGRSEKATEANIHQSAS